MKMSIKISREEGEKIIAQEMRQRLGDAVEESETILVDIPIYSTGDIQIEVGDPEPEPEPKPAAAAEVPLTPSAPQPESETKE